MIAEKDDASARARRSTSTAPRCPRTSAGPRTTTRGTCGRHPTTRTTRGCSTRRRTPRSRRWRPTSTGGTPRRCARGRRRIAGARRATPLFAPGNSPTRSGATSSVSRRISARWSCTATPRWRRSSARCSCSASTTRPRRASWRSFSSRGPTTRRRSSACSGEPPRGSSSRTTRTR